MNKPFNLILNAIKEGEPNQATAWLNQAPDSMLADTVSGLTLRPLGSLHSIGIIETPFVDMALCLRKNAELGDFLEALEQRSGRQAMVPVRLTAISRLLNKGVEDGKPWRIEELLALAGEGGLDPARSLLTQASRAHADDVLARHRLAPPLTPTDGFDWGTPVMAAALAATCAYCLPVLEVLSPTIARAPWVHGNSRDAGISLDRVLAPCDGAMALARWDVTRFKETFDFLVAHDHDPHALDSGKGSLLHSLAENGVTEAMLNALSRRHYANPLGGPFRGLSEDTPEVAILSQKLMHMLDYGLDVSFRNNVDLTAQEVLTHRGFKEAAHRWAVIETTYGARKAALQALAEIDAPKCTIPGRSVFA